VVGLNRKNINNMIYKRYEYLSSKGKVWTKWFKWNSDLRPELQMDDRRIINRLKNEYKEV
jgi:hypothetical protein